MKKLIFLSTILIAMTSCGNSDETACNCEVQRYERTVVRSTSPSNTLISASAWVKVGAPSAFGTDCGTNGTTNGFGSENAYVIDGSTYGAREYENRVTCK